MKKAFSHIIPNEEDWPINRFGKDRKRFVAELNALAEERILAKHGDDIQTLLEKSLYLERQRVKTVPWKVDPADDKTYWKSLQKEVKEAAKREDKDDLMLSILKRVINRYSEEICGRFNIKTYRFAKKFLTVVFKRLLSSATGNGFLRLWGSKRQLLDRLKVVGHVDEARHLFEKGTVVIVPTHFSNLDSVMIGYITDNIVGMPAYSFGAGLNLYDTEIVGYFLNRLGAYRVDRRKKNPIYLECLKSMACLSVQSGINNIFFPGGTRSRDGSIESRLKLGLLGSVVESQRMSVQNGSEDKVFVIPLVLGYHYVLEGRSLVEQHLRRAGKERYSRSKDQGGWSFRKVMRFVWSLFRERSEVYMSFGEPLDVFGNKVDGEGRSLDKYGNLIDLKDYFLLDGEVNANSQRESVYTKILGERIVESYNRNNVVMSSHLMAFLGFRAMMHYYEEEDIYTLFRIPREDFFYEMKHFRAIVQQAMDILKKWRSEGKLMLSSAFDLEVDEFISHGLKNLGQYHNERPLRKDKKGDIVSANFKLLYFYHNRMNNYGLEKHIKWPEINRAEAKPINI